MKKKILGTDQLAQVGILVNDIKLTARSYADFLGVEIPEILITEKYDYSQAELKGKPCTAMCKLAFFQVGPNLEIELLEPDDQPSVWRNDLNSRGEGLHHLAFTVKDMKGKIADLEKESIALIQKAEFVGGRYAYMDGSKDLKILLELLERD